MCLRCGTSRTGGAVAALAGGRGACWRGCRAVRVECLAGLAGAVACRLFISSAGHMCRLPGWHVFQGVLEP